MSPAINKKISYVIIGNGRMATHMGYYLNDLSIEYQQWCRKNHPIAILQEMLSATTHVLVLINDGQIEPFVLQHILPNHPHLTIVHFSGALVTPYAYSAHPLHTFSHQERYPASEYRSVPFIIEKDRADFTDLLPGLPNPNYPVLPEDKAYYHAICMLANNVSTLLWKKFFHTMRCRFDIDPKDLAPFLTRTFHNLQHNPEQALTGPIARGDAETLNRNLQALQGDSFHDLLAAIVQQVNKGVDFENNN